MTKQWYKSSQLGKRYLVLSASSNVAAGTIPILSTYMATAVGWESVYYLMGTLCILATPLLIIGIKYNPENSSEIHQKKDESFQNRSTIHHKDTEEETYSWYGVFLFKEFWLVMMLSTLGWSVRASVIDWMQLYFTQHLNHSHTTGMIITNLPP